MATSTTLSTNETLVDLFNERAVDLLRLEAGTRDKVLVFLSELEGELVAQLARIDPTGVENVTRQRTRLQKLLDEVRSTIRGTYRDISTLMGREIREIIDDEAAWTGRAFNTATQAAFSDTTLTRSVLQNLVSEFTFLGASSEDWWSRQAGGLYDRFKDEMRRGIALGENNGALVARLRGKTGQPGLMDVNRNSAERLVRASVQAAANNGREAMYEKNDDLIKALQWSATLDTRTTDYCKVRDGLLYSNDKEHTPKGHKVPWLEGPGKLHWGCRSTSVPVLKTWRDLGIDEDEIPETTRASMDGQVPAEMTHEAWLRKQSVARQNEALGEGKAQLWRDGKITYRDLLDQSGRPLTTEQLRAKAARR